MSIQSILKDIIKHCGVAGVEVIKITGSDEGIKAQCHDLDKTLFVEGNFAEVIPEFSGEFGITNIKMLSGLLGFSHYQEGSFAVKTRKVNDVEVPSQLQFKGKGSRSTFNLMDNNYVPQQATIAQVPWNIVIDEVTKDMMAEFQQFAGLYSEVDKHFNVAVDDGAIMVTFGQEASSTHSGAMKLVETTQTLANTLSFPVDKFVMLMKLAIANETAKLKFTDKGLLGVDIESDNGVFHYYLRQTVR